MGLAFPSGTEGDCQHEELLGGPRKFSSILRLCSTRPPIRPSPPPRCSSGRLVKQTAPKSRARRHTSVFHIHGTCPLTRQPFHLHILHGIHFCAGQEGLGCVTVAMTSHVRCLWQSLRAQADAGATTSNGATVLPAREGSCCNLEVKPGPPLST